MDLSRNLDDLTPAEREAMASVGHLNALLSHSSIPEAARAAEQRTRLQAAERVNQRNNSGAMNRAQMAGQLRQSEGSLNRGAQQQMVDQIYGNPALAAAGGGEVDLPAKETGQLIDEAQAYSDYATAANQAVKVLDSGGDFKGIPDIFIGLMREGDNQTMANLANRVLYTKGEKSARALISAAHAEQRRAVSGMAVTPGEVGFNADNDPTSSGISAQDSLARLELRQQLINNHRESVGAAPLGNQSGLSKDALQFLGL